MTVTRVKHLLIDAPPTTPEFVNLHTHPCPPFRPKQKSTHVLNPHAIAGEVAGVTGGFVDKRARKHPTHPERSHPLRECNRP